MTVHRAQHTELINPRLPRVKVAPFDQHIPLRCQVIPRVQHRQHRIILLQGCHVIRRGFPQPVAQLGPQRPTRIRLIGRINAEHMAFLAWAALVCPIHLLPIDIKKIGIARQDVPTVIIHRAIRITQRRLGIITRQRCGCISVRLRNIHRRQPAPCRVHLIGHVASEQQAVGVAISARLHAPVTPQFQPCLGAQARFIGIGRTK